MRDFCDEIEDLLIGNEIFQARTRGIGVIPADVALSVRPVRRQPARPAASTGTCAATSRCRWPGTRSTGRSGPTPTATASPAAGCACRRSARPPRSSTSCSTACRPGRSWPRCPRIIKVPEGEAWVSTENPLGEMGYYVVSQGRPRPVPGEDPLGQLQQHLDRAVGAARRVRARHHHDPRQPLLHPRGHRPMIASLAVELPYWRAVAPARRSAASSPCCCRPARSSTLPVQDDVVHAEPARPDGGRPVRLAAAARRGRQVAAEGGHRPRRRPTAASSSWRRSSCSCRRSCSYAVVPVRARRLVRRLPRRHLLRPGRVVGLGARHPHGRLGVGQQVLAARRPARRRPADRLRAADGARPSSAW